MAACPQLEFRAADHAYLIAGRQIPSVTQVLAGCGLADYSSVPAEVLARKARIGDEVHRAIREIEAGTLDWASVSPEAGEYLPAYIAFRATGRFTVVEEGLEPALIEIPLAAQLRGMWCAGTPDQIGLFDSRPTILDFKTTTAIERHWAWQLAGYRLLARELSIPGGPDFGRMVVWLKPGGQWVPVPYKGTDNAKDENVFLSALVIAHAKDKS